MPTREKYLNKAKKIMEEARALASKWIMRFVVCWIKIKIKRHKTTIQIVRKT